MLNVAVRIADRLRGMVVSRVEFMKMKLSVQVWRDTIGLRLRERAADDENHGCAFMDECISATMILFNSLNSCKDMIYFCDAVKQRVKMVVQKAELVVRRLHQSPLGNSSSQDVEGTPRPWPNNMKVDLAMSKHPYRSVKLLHSQNTE